MSETPKPFDPDTLYDVRLARPASFLGATLRPLDTHEMDGAILNALIDQEGADVVDTAVPR